MGQESSSSSFGLSIPVGVTDNNFHRTIAWSELNNQSSYGQADSTTRKSSSTTLQISPQISGEQLSRPFPPRLKLFFFLFPALTLSQLRPRYLTS